MLNNIGLPGMILFTPMLIAAIMGIYSLVKIPNYDASYNYAGFWLRLVAAVIDGIIMTLITLIPAFIVGYMIGESMAGTAPVYEIEATAGAVGNLIGFVVGWLYYTLMESSKHQATFGKKILGIRVVDLNGGRIGFGKANGRYFGKLLSVLTLFIGHFMMGWTKKKQALYDKMAGCLVVRNSSPALLASNPLQETSNNFGASSITQATSENDTFESEALRRFKNDEIDEDTMLKLMRKR